MEREQKRKRERKADLLYSLIEILSFLLPQLEMIQQ
jgi:hypothetical protein